MRSFGLIGKKLTHSFSANYFVEKFQKEGIRDARYQNFELSNIADIKSLFQNKELLGLNVTIPYKESIIPYLDEIDPIAKKIGAVNTIHLINGKSIGYNTDVIGFEQSLQAHLTKNHQQALVFGSGGASKAICYVLDKLNISYQLVSRTVDAENRLQYADLTTALIADHPLLINCTPIGMHPAIDEIIPIPIEGIEMNHLVYDLIYNPLETKLLHLAKEKGAKTINGLQMLQIQAEASWEIWNA